MDLGLIFKNLPKKESNIEFDIEYMKKVEKEVKVITEICNEKLEHQSTNYNIRSGKGSFMIHSTKTRRQIIMVSQLKTSYMEENFF